MYLAVMKSEDDVNSCINFLRFLFTKAAFEYVYQNEIKDAMLQAITLFIFNKVIFWLT